MENVMVCNCKQVSVADIEKVREAIKGVDYVVNMAAVIPPESDKNPHAAIEANEIGPKVIVQAIEELGASEEIITEMLTLYTIQAKVYDAVIVDVDRNVKDEDANMRGYSYVVINLVSRVVDGKTVKTTTLNVTKDGCTIS